MDIEQKYELIKTGLQKYLHENNFTKVILGLSGGIDSALTAAISSDAIGSENVLLYALPSRYNSDASLHDAQELSHNLNTKLNIISIEPLFQAMLDTVEMNDLAKENAQSRIRGTILMSVSNTTNAMLLCTGNKSEASVGYFTLYGDSCGGLAPIGNLYKWEVYEMAKWINRNGEIIPSNIITKPPSAELRDNQKDSDSLPEYDILDEILYMMTEENMQSSEIISKGYDEAAVMKIFDLYRKSEFKRKQIPACIK